jgi:hypothetical protein
MYSDYLRYSPEQLQVRLADVMESLANLYEKVGWLKSTSIRDGVKTFQSSLEPSIAARSREAQYATCEVDAQLAEDQARIQSLTMEKEYIQWLANQ